MSEPILSEPRRVKQAKKNAANNMKVAKRHERFLENDAQ